MWGWVVFIQFAATFCRSRGGATGGGELSRHVKNTSTVPGKVIPVPQEEQQDQAVGWVREGGERRC